MIRRSNMFFRKKAIVILSFILFGSTLVLGIASGVYINNIKDKTGQLQVSLEDESFAYNIREPHVASLATQTKHVNVSITEPNQLIAYGGEWAQSQDDVTPAIMIANEKLEYLKNVQDNTHKLESMVFVMLSFNLLLSFLLICYCLSSFSIKRRKRIAKRGGDVGGEIVRTGHHNDAFSKLINILHSKFKSVRQ